MASPLQKRLAQTEQPASPLQRRLAQSSPQKFKGYADAADFQRQNEARAKDAVGGDFADTAFAAMMGITAPFREAAPKEKPLPPSNVPEGTVFGDVGGTWKDIPVQAAETLLDSERLGVTGADAETPMLNTVGNVGSMVGQALIGGAGVARNLPRMTPLAQKLATGTIMGTQSQLRTEGLESPTNTATAALMGAAGGAMAPASIGGASATLGADVSMGVLDMIRRDPTAADIAVKVMGGDELTPEEKSYALQVGLLNAVPSLVGSAASMAGARAQTKQTQQRLVGEQNQRAQVEQADLDAAVAREQAGIQQRLDAEQSARGMEERMLLRNEIAAEQAAREPIHRDIVRETMRRDAPQNFEFADTIPVRRGAPEPNPEAMRQRVLRDKIAEDFREWQAQEQIRTQFRKFFEQAQVEAPQAARGGDTEAGLVPRQQAPEAARVVDVSHETISSPEAMGLVPPGLFEMVNEIGNTAGKWLRVRGNLPESAHETRQAGAAFNRGQIQRIKFSVADVRREVRKAVRGKAFANRDEAMKAVDDVLHGNPPSKPLPPELQAAVDNMRAHIDEHSDTYLKLLPEREMRNLDMEIRSAVRQNAFPDYKTAQQATRDYLMTGQQTLPLPPKLLAHTDAARKGLAQITNTIKSNQGSYVRRSYEMFDNKKFRINEQDLDNAVVAMRGQMPGMSDTEIKDSIRAYIVNAAKSPDRTTYLGEGRIGSEALSTLMKRKDISEPMRRVMGEYGDPLTNYAKSIAGMSEFIARERVNQAIIENGLNSFLFQAPHGENIHSVKIGEAEFYTNKPIADAIADIDARFRPEGWVRGLMVANAFAKVSKTLLSHVTQIRNFASNILIQVANGNWRAWKAGESTTLLTAKMTKANNKQWRDRIVRLTELGVIGDSTHAREIHDIMSEAFHHSDELNFAASLTSRIAKAPIKGATELYQAGDDFFKIYAFENELARLRKAMPGMSLDQLERESAKIVRDTVPTYSNTPRITQALRRFPVTGPFVSWYSEILRTSYNILKRGTYEMKTPGLRGIGAQRLLGAMVAGAAVPATALMTRAWFGVSDEEDEALRRHVPEWSANSNIVYLGKPKGGKVSWLDASFMDPYAILRKPIIAAMRGEDWESAFVGAASEMGAPFLSEELVTAKIIDHMRNANRENGAPIYNEHDTPERQYETLFNHYWDALEPGSLTSGKRVYKAYTGKTEGGKEYDPTLETIANFGMRLQKTDSVNNMSFKADAFKSDLSEAQSILTQTIQTRGTVAPEEIAEAYASMDTARRRIFDEMRADMLAARALGATDRELFGIMRSNGLTGPEIKMLASGNYVPYAPSAEVFGTIARNVSREDAAERARIVREQYLKARQKGSTMMAQAQ